MTRYDLYSIAVEAFTQINRSALGAIPTSDQYPPCVATQVNRQVKCLRRAGNFNYQVCAPILLCQSQHALELSHFMRFIGVKHAVRPNLPSPALPVVDTLDRK